MKSAGSPPAAPDPVQTAAAQGKENRQTAAYEQAMNFVNQTTPLGSLTYTQLSPGNANTPPQWQSTVTLSPEGQKSFDLQQQVGTALNNLALKGTGQVTSALDKPQDYSGLPSVPSSLDLSGLPQIPAFDTSKLPAAQQSLDFSNLPAMTGIDLSKLGDMPAGLDLSSLGARPTANADVLKGAQDAAYSNATAILDPQWEKSQRNLETQLVNSGIARGTPAWDQAMSEFNQSKSSAYGAARNDAFNQGLAAESNQFGIENTAYNTGLNALQQQLADALGIRSQGLNEQETALDAAIKGRQQGMSEQQSQFNATNQARQNALAEMLTGIDVASGTRQQGLSEAEAQAAQAAAARQQGITESNYLRELPINEISALLNGGQVQFPQFGSTGNTQVQPVDIAGLINQNYNQRYQQYQQRLQQQNAMWGGLASLGGTLGSALILA